MDPETESQLAAMIMEEASRLRREAERDGVGAYLSKPRSRARANPQFLQATVRSIQQSNRIVEVNEMWRRRKVELENGVGKSALRRGNNSYGESSDDHEDTAMDRRHRHDSDDEGSGDGELKDDELEQFLHSRLKRGRGAVGSRMDETGPYLPSQADKQLSGAPRPDERLKDEWEERIIGPQAGPSVNGRQTGGWDRESWKRKERHSSDEEAVKEEARSRRRKDRKEKKSKGERDSKREEKKKKRKKLEKSSKRRR
ncbi:unnamed protein product [Calypogeia fissa]